MMKKGSLILSILFLICISMRCKENSFLYKRYRLDFNNASQYTINLMIASVANLNPVYPDTILPVNNFFHGQPIRPKTMCGIYDGGISLSEIINKLPSDTLSLYLIIQDTLLNYPWDTIRSRYLILQRYDLSFKDLDHRKFVIEYPYDETKGKLKVFTP